MLSEQGRLGFTTLGFVVETHHQKNNYLNDIMATCHWIANAGVQYAEPIDGRYGESARSPIGYRDVSAIEELIELKTIKAERLQTHQ